MLASIKNITNNLFPESDEETRFQGGSLLLIHLTVTLLLILVWILGYTDPAMKFSLFGIIFLSITSIVFISMGYLTISTIFSYTGIGILVTLIVFGRAVYNNFEVYMLATLHMFIVLVSTLLTKQRFYTIYTTGLGLTSIVLLYFFRGLPLQGRINPIEIDDYFVAFTLLALSGIILLRTTERRKQLLLTAERESRAVAQSLKEKEILLNEIHHRVKNNLNVAISLLRMQMTQPETVPELANSLQDSINRLQSMALVHERLYAGGNFSSVAFKPYIMSILNSILISYESKGIAFEVDVDDHLEVELDRAIDYGVGIPEQDWSQSGSLGMRVVTLLTEQLSGKLKISNIGGSQVQIRFPKQSG